MTHDQTCTFDPRWCSSCKLQAEARADERSKMPSTVIEVRWWTLGKWVHRALKAEAELRAARLEQA